MDSTRIIRLELNSRIRLKSKTLIIAYTCLPFASKMTIFRIQINGILLMQINKLTRILFSPTGTTRKIIFGISDRMDYEEEQTIDLTHPANRENLEYHSSRKDELFILAVPVYEERIPEVIKASLENIKGNGQPIALVAVYGNIGYGLCLKEMQDWARKAGFIVVAGAAFIGEHSFSHDQLPLAKGRPDMMDLYHARHFGNSIMKKVERINNIIEYKEQIFPGQLPLMAKLLPGNSSKFFAQYPTVNHKKCNQCKLCNKMCPSGAINPETLEIDKSKCLHCFSCVRVCKPGARNIKLKMSPIVKSVLNSQTSKNKLPEIFI